MAGVPGDTSRSLRPEYPVRTERLQLRPLTVGDIDALLGYRSRVDVCRYVPFEPMTREEITERLATHWERTELTGEGQALTLGVALAETGRVVGDVMLFWRSRADAEGELGYVFDPDCGGRGYATEAASAVLRLGFEGLGLHRIVARVDERNEPSVRLARRLGMRQEARLVQNEFFKGEWSTELDFAILADEWRDGAFRPGAAPRPELVGGRVRLRPGRPGDAARLHAVLAEPSVSRWWGEPDPVPEIEDKLRGDDSSALLVVEVDGKLAGGIQYHEENEPTYRHAGIDIYLGSDSQGLGAGRDAVRLLARFLFEQRGHHRITIDPAVANDRAIRCYAAVGFRPVGVMRQYERGRDRSFHDGLLMDLLRGELTTDQ
jgi:RimJ/RimL family protein N-acetyltransferase